MFKLGKYLERFEHAESAPRSIVIYNYYLGSCLEGSRREGFAPQAIDGMEPPGGEPSPREPSRQQPSRREPATVPYQCEEPESLPGGSPPGGSPASFVMPRAVHDELIEILGSVPPEACGILLGPRKHASLITHFLRDESGTSSPVSFQIDGERMTEAIQLYTSAGLDVKGIVHSHPSGFHQPSSGDLAYLKKLFANRKNVATPATTAFYFPILSDGKLFHFVYDRSGGEVRLKPAKLVLI